MPERSRQLVSGILEDLWHALPHIGDALWHHQAELPEQATNLVGLRSARLNEALAHTVERQYGLLFDAFDRHEAHVRSGDRLTDRLGIGDIVLVGFHIGLDELRGHQAHRMSKTLQSSGPVMRTTAGFHPDQARRQLREERRHWSRLSCFFSTALPRSSTPCTWNTFFARSMPIVVIFIADAPLGSSG